MRKVFTCASLSCPVRSASMPKASVAHSWQKLECCKQPRGQKRPDLARRSPSDAYHKGSCTDRPIFLGCLRAASTARSWVGGGTPITLVPFVVCVGVVGCVLVEHMRLHVRGGLAHVAASRETADPACGLLVLMGYEAAAEDNHLPLMHARATAVLAECTPGVA